MGRRLSSAESTPRTLSRLLARESAVVAPRLLGSVVWSDIGGNRVAIRLTEVEAYGGQGEDPGSHAYRRLTPRNATMFGPSGRLYVYFTYGMHWCANVVTGPDGEASAVLLRAGEVIEGLDAARARRPSAAKERDLARGPARLCAALGLTGECDGVDLLSADSPVRLTLARRPAPVHAVTARTGVSGPGADTPWRFAADDPTVSPYRPAATRGRGAPRTGGR